jgi:hypothetical protein
MKLPCFREDANQQDQLENESVDEWYYYSGVYGSELMLYWKIGTEDGWIRVPNVSEVAAKKGLDISDIKLISIAPENDAEENEVIVLYFETGDSTGNPFLIKYKITEEGELQYHTFSTRNNVEPPSSTYERKDRRELPNKIQDEEKRMIISAASKYGIDAANEQIIFTTESGKTAVLAITTGEDGFDGFSNIDTVSVTDQGSIWITDYGDNDQFLYDIEVDGKAQRVWKTGEETGQLPRDALFSRKLEEMQWPPAEFEGAKEALFQEYLEATLENANTAISVDLFENEWALVKDFDEEYIIALMNEGGLSTLDELLTAFEESSNFFDVPEVTDVSDERLSKEMGKMTSVTVTDWGLLDDIDAGYIMKEFRGGVSYLVVKVKDPRRTDEYTLVKWSWNRRVTWKSPGPETHLTQDWTSFDDDSSEWPVIPEDVKRVFEETFYVKMAENALVSG